MEQAREIDIKATAWTGRLSISEQDLNNSSAEFGLKNL